MTALDASIVPRIGCAWRGPRAARRPLRRRSLVSRVKSLSEPLWVFAALVAAVALVGHALDIPRFYQPWPQASAMHPLTGLLVLMAWLAHRLSPRSRWRYTSISLVLLLAAVTTVHMPWTQLPDLVGGIGDSIALQDQKIRVGTNSAAGLLACALAMFLLLSKRPIAAQIVALFALMPPMVSATGYLLRLNGFHGEMSPLTTAALLAIAAALVAGTARHGVIRSLLSPSDTGRIMRLFLAAMTVILPLFGLVLPTLVEGPEAVKSLAIFMVAECSIVTAIILTIAAMLERQDAKSRRAARSMRRASQIDPLTGAWNRRALEARLHDFDRTTDPLAVLALDIDHFKRVNDEFGHATGDELLREFTELLRASVRSTDTVVRTGGEEFVILLPNANTANAISMAQMLRERVAQHQFRAFADTDRRITISAGCAARLGFGRVAPLLDRADRALYAAKLSGRDCVLPVPAGAKDERSTPSEPEQAQPI